jgi:hypothetical protein
MLNMFLNFPEIEQNTLFIFGCTDVSVCWVSFLFQRCGERRQEILMPL